MSKNKDWKKTKTIYWRDEVNDDFDEVGLSRPGVPENYKYIRNNPINNFFSGILYHGVAKPILGLFCVCHGIRFKNKKNLKDLGDSGAYLYSNHVSISDVFKFQSQAFFFKRRVNILGYSDTLSMPIVRNIARALGYLPVPLKGDIKNMMSLGKACEYYVSKKQFVLIYPEAHIWPYYTKIRNFPEGSFSYPSRSDALIVPIVTTWRKPKIGNKPKQTIYFGKPIFPKESLTINENKNYLHDECLKIMKEIADSIPQYEYIDYIHEEIEKKDID